jgi:hypothetical protein
VQSRQKMVLLGIMRFGHEKYSFQVWTVPIFLKWALGARIDPDRIERGQFLGFARDCFERRGVGSDCSSSLR